MRLLLFSLLLYASAAAGATLDLEAFDVQRCLHWHMTSDVQGATSPAFGAAKAKTRVGYDVFSAGAFRPDGTAIEKFGVCSYERQGRTTRFHCLAGQDYPFAGATYVASQSQGDKYVTALHCTAGCGDRVPNVVYETGQDIPENVNDYEKAEHARASNFHRKCGAR